MAWILKGLLLAAKSKRGRELLFAGAVAVLEIAQSPPARRLYARGRGALTDPRPRAVAAEAVRTVKRRIKR